MSMTVRLSSAVRLLAVIAAMVVSLSAVPAHAAWPERTITILTLGGDHCLPTKGHFQMTSKFLEGPDGAPLGMEQRVDSKSVYSYVLPRLHSLMGRLLRAY